MDALAVKVNTEDGSSGSERYDQIGNSVMSKIDQLYFCYDTRICFFKVLMGMVHDCCFEGNNVCGNPGRVSLPMKLLVSYTVSVAGGVDFAA